MKAREVATLAALLTLALALRLLLFGGVRVIDHVLTAKYAHQMAEGTYAPVADHVSFRIAYLGPTAVFQGVFGLNDFGCAAFTLLCSLATVSLVFVVASRWGGFAAGLGAGSVMALLPLDVILSTQLCVDGPSAFFAASGGFLFLSAGRRAGLLVAGGLLAGIAYLMKETGAFVMALPVILGLLRKDFRLCLWPVAGWGGVVGLEMALWGFGWGHPFLRWTSTSVAQADAWHVYFPDTASVVKRLTVEFPSMMGTPFHGEFPYFVLFFWLAIGGFILLRRDSRGRELALWAFLALVLVWFFPNRLSPYRPALLAYARHLYPLIAPCAVAIGLAASRIARRKAVPALGLHLALCVIASVGIGSYQDRWMQGVREAFRFAEEQGTGRLYVEKNMVGLFDYYRGFRPGAELIRHEYLSPDQFEEGLLLDHPEWRESVGLSAAWSGREPAEWKVLWDREFPRRRTPGDLLRGTGSGTFKLRVLRVGRGG